MSGLPDINEDGSEVVVKLLYLRYGSSHEDEFDTIEEAKQSAEGLVEWNHGAPVAIVIDGDLKLYNRYKNLQYEWTTPDSDEAAYVKSRWPQYFQPKEISDGRGSPS